MSRMLTGDVQTQWFLAGISSAVRICGATTARPRSLFSGLAELMEVEPGQVPRWWPPISPDLDAARGSGLRTAFVERPAGMGAVCSRTIWVHRTMTFFTPSDLNDLLRSLSRMRRAAQSTPVRLHRYIHFNSQTRRIPTTDRIVKSTSKRYYNKDLAHDENRLKYSVHQRS